MRKSYIIVLFFLFLFPTSIYALEFPSTHSKNILLYDQTDDQVLFESNSNEITSIASLTKVMTAITALEKGIRLDEKITINKFELDDIYWNASVAGLKAGDTVTYLDLLYALLLPSGADAAHVLAINVSGDVDSFVEEMNQLAEKIGMKNTHFENVTGLDIENHYSTADDLLLLIKYALQNETFKKVYETKSYTLSSGLQVKSTVNKYSEKMGYDISRIIGSKTGFTYDAGLCIALTFTSNNHDMILILLGADYKTGLYYNIIDANEIIHFVDENYKVQTIVEKDKNVKSIEVKLSNIEQYEIKPKNDIQKYLPIDYNPNDVRIIYDGKDQISYKDKKGSKLGTISYYYQDRLISMEDIYLEVDLKPNILKIMKQYYIEFILFGVVLLLGIFIIKKIINR